MGLELGGSKGEQSSSTTVDIPDFLQPYLNQGADLAGSTLSELSGIASNMFAGFDPLQTRGQDMAVGVAEGAGGFLPTAEQYFLNTAQGTGLEQILPPEAYSALTGAAAGGGDLSALPPEAREALSATARGDFLYGGEGFDAATEAALNRAMPNIRSMFGGTTGGMSGIAPRELLGQYGIDAFASQYGAERDRQLGAASALGGFGDRSLDRSLDASSLLSSFTGAERDRQERAAGALPDIGLARSDILRGVGADRRQEEQERLRSPFDGNMMLMQAIMAGLPIEALLGQSSYGESSNFGFGLGVPGS